MSLEALEFQGFLHKKTAADFLSKSTALSGGDGGI